MPPDYTTPKAVADYLLVETELAPADLIFVFGCAYPELLAERAAELFHRGIAPRILVSGGVDTAAGIPEWKHVAQEMVRRGVPPGAILVEKQATHTGENCMFGRAVAEAALGEEAVSSIVCIGAIHASRRYAMTLERHWPGPVKMLSPVNPFSEPRERWTEDATFRTRAMAEWSKLRGYFAQDFLREIDVPAINRWAEDTREAAAALRGPRRAARRPAAPRLALRPS